MWGRWKEKDQLLSPGVRATSESANIVGVLRHTKKGLLSCVQDRIPDLEELLWEEIESPQGGECIGPGGRFEAKFLPNECTSPPAAVNS